MRKAKWPAAALAFTLSTLAADEARALATLTLVVADPPGVGFNDPTPAAPVGGNMGTTVGEQRKIAFEYALGLWGKLLESPVPILVSMSFAPLPCEGDTAVLAHAGPTSVEFDVPGADPDLIIPEALADQIAGFDLEPGLPDIEGEFNGSLPECFGDDWYYGLDGLNSRDLVDLVSTALHEIGHGLGFLSMVDPESGGDLSPGRSDPFSTHLLDLATNKHWHEMTPAERSLSATSVRGLVWDGRYVTEAAATLLTLGAPHIATLPLVPGVGDAVVDANFGPRVSTPIVGPVAAATPSAGCTDITAVSGTIAVAPGDTCHPMNIAYAAAEVGAIAVLITENRDPPTNLDVPAEDLDFIPVDIPVFGISQADGALLLAADGVTVTLSSDATQRTGTDPQGRVYMYSSSPVRPSSTASHFDTIARPDLILEPSHSVNTNHDITLERALLRDIGWLTRCGNGMPDPGEECDNGASNSDALPDACRTSCRRAFCADGIVDTGEACDPGSSGSGDPTCTSTCTRPVCGNSLLEPGEECDQGAANSDSVPNACRTTCKNPSCGDGAVDTGEACDDALTPDTCERCALTGSAGAGGGGGGGLGGGAGAVTPGGSKGTDADDDDDDDDDDEGGCGCRVLGHDANGTSSLVLLAALVAFAGRVRSRRARRSR